MLSPSDEKRLPAHYDDLDEILDEAWRLISRGVKNRRSPFHTPTVVTVGHGGRPSVRTVVLRGTDRPRGRLRFHTDRRSALVGHLSENDALAMHVYDSPRRIQIRVDGTAAFSTPAQHVKIWERMQPHARASYRTELAPGTPLPEPPQPGPAMLDEGDAFANFCVVDVRIRRLEWLFLSAQGHRRAAFLCGPEGQMGTWLVP